MKITIEPEVVAKFPSVMIGVVIANGIDNRRECADLGDALCLAEKNIRESLIRDQLSQHPKVNCWRKAYSAFGVKPDKARCSLENLLRMVTAGKDLRRINPLVDLYNLVCLTHLFPVGGEDLSKVVGDISLRIAGAHEVSAALLGSEEPEIPPEGEVMYADEAGVICRRWNWREADRTKLTAETTKAILVVDAVSPATYQEVKVATDNLAELAQKYCEAEVVTTILTAENPILALAA